MPIVEEKGMRSVKKIDFVLARNPISLEDALESEEISVDSSAMHP